MLNYDDDGSGVDFENYLLRYVQTDQIRIVELIFQMCKFEQKWLDNALIVAYKSDVDMVQQLIDNGANIDKYGKKLYRKAKKHKNKKLANFLEEYNEE